MKCSTLQLGLFAREPLAIDETFARAERVELGPNAWVEIVRGWVRGDRELFDHLVATAPWRDEERVMYDHVVAVPRRIAVLDRLHSTIIRVRESLDARYATSFERISVAHYRDGRDSVAWHGDYVARKLDTALVATVSLGSPRRFLIRPKGGGPSRAWTLSGGDLVVMGGTSQRTHEHSVPKVASAGPRVALMFRPVWHEPT
ncbi:MAG TPA: alpha-ketoglutarate-dependent dioxygenase AlkB [Polyangiaceae bacterium]|jgi:alkylated DNA repair dioxygenase AlkB